MPLRAVVHFRGIQNRDGPGLVLDKIHNLFHRLLRATDQNFVLLELRDGGSSYGGRDVSQALHLITTDVAPMITGQSWTSIGQADAALAALDGTPNHRRLGANSVVATSIAMARALAAAAELPLWRWIADVTGSTPRLPVPHFNVLNGGAHAANALDFQEFMIAPVNAETMTDAVRIGSDVYHALAALVRERFGSLGLGDEGGFAPSIAAPEEALDLLVAAISAAGSARRGHRRDRTRPGGERVRAR